LFLYTTPSPTYITFLATAYQLPIIERCAMKPLPFGKISPDQVVVLEFKEQHRHDPWLRSLKLTMPHGVLWISDQIEQAKGMAFSDLADALARLDADPLVFLPAGEVAQRIARLRTKARGR
jgi:hypothetical protein